MVEKIFVVCVVCGKEYEVKKNRDYKIRIKNKLFYCSKACTWSSKAKKLRAAWQAKCMREKYGYENSFQFPEVIKKIRIKKDEFKTQKTRENTFLRKYGVKNPQQIKNVKEKTKKNKFKKIWFCICVEF